MVGDQAVVRIEGLAQRVQRAGADVAEDHADRAHHQAEQADPAMAALAQAFDLIPISTEGNCPF